MKVNTIGDAMGFIGLRGFVAGAIFGGLYGLVSFSLYGVMIGALLGAIVGLIAGLLVGLIVMLIIRAFMREVGDVRRFRAIVALLTGLFTLLIVAYAFSILWSNEPEMLIVNPLLAWITAFGGEKRGVAGIPSIIAGLYAAYAGRNFAKVYLQSSGVFLPEENEHVHKSSSLNQGAQQ